MKRKTTVLAGPSLVQLLVEHLDTGDRRLLGRADAHNLDLQVDREGAALGATRHNGSTTGDREDVLDKLVCRYKQINQ
jgi:phage head maturation protease